MSSRSTIGKGGRFDAREREFVKSVYPGMGPAAIAKKLGRSKSGICNLIKQMKADGELRGPESTAKSNGDTPGTALNEEDGTQDTLGRLRRLRSILERQLLDADTGQVARLSAEYRAVVEDISRLESKEGGDGDDVLDRLAVALTKRGPA